MKFSNLKQGHLLITCSLASFLTGLAIGSYEQFVRKSQSFELFAIFFSIAIVSFWFAYTSTVNIELNENLLNVEYPYRKKTLRLSFKEIKAATYNELAMNVTIELIDNRSFKIPSSSIKLSGEFQETVPVATGPYGSAGDLYLLANLINKKISESTSVD